MGRPATTRPTRWLGYDRTRWPEAEADIDLGPQSRTVTVGKRPCAPLLTGHCFVFACGPTPRPGSALACTDAGSSEHRLLPAQFYKTILLYSDSTGKQGDRLDGTGLQAKILRIFQFRSFFDHVDRGPRSRA